MIEIFKNKDTEETKIDNISKPYTQFSKKIIAFLLGNLIVIEVFVMSMCIWLRDMSPVPYLITSIAATILSGIVWYLKNSEAEKKARIQAEVDKMKIRNAIIENEPDTYYKESEHIDDIDVSGNNFPLG